MSVKCTKITEPRVTSIEWKVLCDGCGAKMMEETVQTAFYEPSVDYRPSINLLPGWVELAKGAFGNRVKAHACPRCSEHSTGSLLSKVEE